MATSVGFIGVGLMGHGMAKNLLEKGHPLTVLGNRNRAPVEDLLSRGAREAKNPADLTKSSDVVFICVTSSDQVEGIMRGKDGVLSAVRPGQIVIDTSTSDPQSTLRLAADLEAKGAKMVDAPLGRTPREAEQGRLNVFVGAEPETFEKVRPLIACFGENILHVGPLGAGHTIKLINNFLSIAYTAVWAEAYTACRKTGIEPKTFYEVIKAGGMYCGNFENNSKWAIGRDPNAHVFTLANCLKDIRYFNTLADRSGMGTLIGSAVQQAFALAVAQGEGGRYMPMLTDVLCDLNGIQFAPAERQKTSAQAS